LKSPIHPFRKSHEISATELCANCYTDNSRFLAVLVCFGALTCAADLGFIVTMAMVSEAIGEWLKPDCLKLLRYVATS
jgi:hypothetical protein